MFRFAVFISSLRPNYAGITTPRGRQTRNWSAVANIDPSYLSNTADTLIRTLNREHLSRALHLVTSDAASKNPLSPRASRTSSP